VTPTRSHKLNTALAQAYYAREERTERLTTETGTGQWGSALSYAGTMFDLNILVFMVRVSYNQKPYRKFVMKLYGAQVVPSPSDRTEVGRKFLKEDPEHADSLRTEISEAIEVAVKDERTKYSLGSVLNHVLLHQTVIGLEIIEQMNLLDLKPDFVISCVGGEATSLASPFP